MSRSVLNWRVKADNKFKQYFKRWEVFKSCQYRIKEYFENKINGRGRRICLDEVQGPQENELDEKYLFERLLLPLLESDNKKYGSLEDLVGQEPVQVNETRKKCNIDESWKRSIKKYKIEGFLCVPSLYKYDPYEPNLLRTSSDTCVRYENYQSRIPPEQQYWGLHKRGSTAPKKEGSVVGGGKGVQFDKRTSVEPISELNLIQDAQKPEDRPKPLTQDEVAEDCHELTSLKGDQVTGNRVKETTTSSSSSIDDSLMRKFSRPVCNQQKPLSNGPGKTNRLKLTAVLSSLSEKVTRCTKSRYTAHRISDMKKTSCETVAVKTTRKVAFDKSTSFQGRSSHMQVKPSVEPKCEKTTKSNTTYRFACKDHISSVTKTQNAEFHKMNSAQGTQLCCGGSGQIEEDAQQNPSVQRKFVNSNKRFASDSTGYQHFSSMCGARKPNLGSLALDASKLSRSIKTSNTNEVPPTPNQKRNFQYQCRQKQCENTGKKLLRVMNYCFESHAMTPGKPDATSTLKSENKRVLGSDKVCCGWDGMKKKDRQYGSNFSVKASKSHFDLTTQVLLQARGLRK